MPLTKWPHKQSYLSAYLILSQMLDRVTLGSPLTLARSQHCVKSSLIVHICTYRENSAYLFEIVDVLVLDLYISISITTLVFMYHAWLLSIQLSQLTTRWLSLPMT